MSTFDSRNYDYNAPAPSTVVEETEEVIEDPAVKFDQRVYYPETENDNEEFDEKKEKNASNQSGGSFKNASNQSGGNL